MTNHSTILSIWAPLAFIGLAVACCACKGKPQTSEPRPVSVRIMVLDSTGSATARTYVGEVKAEEVVALSFPVGGKVEKVLVKEGDVVRAGQKLALVDRSTAQSAYNSAKAQLEQAEDGYRRLKKVYEQGSLPEVKWVEMLTNLEKARAMEQMARKQLEDCALTAPVDGVVGDCNITAGGSLLPGATALTLLNVAAVRITFAVPESEIADVSDGDDVTVEIPALGHGVLNGKISGRSMTASMVSHCYEVTVPLPNTTRELRPGMVCKVHLPQADSRGIVIPAKSVQTRPEGHSVWVCRQGIAERRTVEVRTFVADGVLVSAGLMPQDTLIVEGIQKLYKGAKIAIQ